MTVAEFALTLDGRNTDAKRRDDLRVAALPLRRYWTGIAGRSGSITSEPSKAVDFLLACLCLIDPTVTDRLIADFDH